MGKERFDRERPLAAALLGICLLATLVISACGADATAGKKNHGTSTAAAAESGGRGGLPQGSEPVKLDPAEFTIRIDNPYWPMAPEISGSTGRPTSRGQSSASR